MGRRPTIYRVAPYVFWLSLSIRLPKGKGEEVKAQGGVFFDDQSFSG